MVRPRLLPPRAGAAAGRAGGGRARRLPLRTVEGLQALPGVGPYTARALACSLAFGRRGHGGRHECPARVSLGRALGRLDVPPTPPAPGLRLEPGAVRPRRHRLPGPRAPRCGACPLAAGCPGPRPAAPSPLLRRRGAERSRNSDRGACRRSWPPAAQSLPACIRSLAANAATAPPPACSVMASSSAKLGCPLFCCCEAGSLPVGRATRGGARRAAAAAAGRRAPDGAPARRLRACGERHGAAAVAELEALCR